MTPVGLSRGRLGRRAPKGRRVLLQPLQFEALRKAAIRCIDELLPKLTSALLPPVASSVLSGLADFDRDALRELATNLRSLGYEGPARRLETYKARYSKYGLDRGMSQCPPEQIELFQSSGLSVPTPLADPNQQAEAQEFRGHLAKAALESLAALLRAVRVELAEPARAAGGQGGAGAGRRARRRGKRARELTPKQAKVVELHDVQNQSFGTIASVWGKSIQSVQQLYERAKVNPGYKKARSINLARTKALHPNTRSKFRPADDE